MKKILNIKKIKKSIFIKIFLFSIIIVNNLHAFYWTEDTKSSFDQGYVYRTTVTAQGKIQIRDWDDWWNSDWPTRIPIEIDNRLNSSQLVDYQISFTTNIKPYVDENKLDQNGTSIRITGSDGKTLQNFWIENWNITTSTGSKFWVRVSTIPANSITYIYMYFRNQSTNSLSDINGVFDLYEDWETGKIRNNTPWSATGWVVGGNQPFIIHTSTDILTDFQYNGYPSITTGTVSVIRGNFDVTNSLINHNQNSSLSTQLNLSMPGIIEFIWKANCEGGNPGDWFKFFVNGEERRKTGSFPTFSEESWSTTLPAGTVTLLWKYEKDHLFTAFFDRGWLDNIVVRKYTSIPPTVSPKQLESFSPYYTYGYFLSQVFDTEGENSEFIYSSWTVNIPPNSNVYVYARSSNTIFNKIDTYPTFSNSLTNNSNPSALLPRGRYVQYKIEFFSDGSTSAYVNSVNFGYKPLPLRAYNFNGIARSSTVIEWNWTNRATYYIDGYRIYSATRSYPSNWLITTLPNEGLLAELTSDTTFWIETNLQPNTQYGRYVVAYTTTIYTFAGNASRNINGIDAPTYKYTIALEPDVKSERYKEIADSPFYQFVEISTQVWYDTIQDTGTSNNFKANNFSFTSALSTGPNQIAYYRYIFQTTTTWSDANSSLWYPSSNTYRNDIVADIIERPIIFVTPLQNSSSWYFLIRSYNGDNLLSGEKILGPYWFSGCPSRITDLVSYTAKTVEGGALLTWTAPTANKDSGNLVNGKFVIKFRRHELGGIIDTEEKYNSITEISTSSGMISGTIIISTTVTAGTRCNYVVTGLVPGFTYWFSIKSMDSVEDGENISEISVSTETILSRAIASKIHRLEFMTPPQTIFAGSISQKMTVRCVDIDGDEMVSRFGAECDLLTTSASGEFSVDGGANFSAFAKLNISPGGSKSDFYYRDSTAGDFTITVDEIKGAQNFEGSQNWLSATQNIKILPKKALSFTAVPQDGNYSARVQFSENVYIDAIDDVGNRDQKFEGVAVVTTTVPGIVITPSSVTFTLSDQGRKSVVLQNSIYAGPLSLTISETVAQDFKYINYLDINNLNIVGNKGMIKTTDDSGNKWFTQFYQNDSYYGLNSISVGGNITLAVGNNGLIIRSTDTFVSHTSTTISSEHLNNLYFVNDSTIIICGNNGKIYKSTDSGNNYNLIASGVSENLYSISFVNISTGYICGANSVLLKTFDGGNTFETLTVNGTDFYKIQFVDENTGFMVGRNGGFFKTTNGGITWSSATVVSGKVLYGLDFITPSKGVVCGENGSVYLTTNAGGSFNNISPPNEQNTTFYSIKFLNATTILVVGSNGTIYKSTNDGVSWTKVVMSGTSPNFLWNGTICIPETVATTNLRQGKETTIARLGIRFYYPQSPYVTTKISQFTIDKVGSLSDSDISYIKVFEGSTELGSGVFTNNKSIISIPVANRPLISDTTKYFYFKVFIKSDAQLDATLALKFDYGCVTVSEGIQFVRNNLPYITYKDTSTLEYFKIAPPAVDVYLVDVDTKPYLIGGSSLPITSAEQGDEVQMLSFGLRTNLSESPFRKLRLNLVGTNVVDSDIKVVKIYQDAILPSNLISTQTFSGGTALLSFPDEINNPSYNGWGRVLNNSTTKYFYVVAEISPDSGFSIPNQEINFALRTLITTTYFLLDTNNENSITSQVSGITNTLQSKNVRIEVSKDVVYIKPLSDIVAQLPVSIKQSQRGILLPIGVSIDGGAATWSRLKVDQISNATNNYTRFGRSSSTVVELWRDNGNGNLDTNDIKIGEGKIENNTALVVFYQPERIDSDFVKNDLGRYATYFITCYIPKNAIPDEKLQLRLAASTYFTLGGVDIVSGNNFPLTSPEITIADFDDDVEVKITSLLQSETVLFETNVLVANIDLLATADATLQKLTITQEGNADNDTVSLVKIYLDNGDLKFDPNSDIVVSTGIFNSSGKCDLTFFNPNGSLAYNPVLVLDTGARLFITFDFNLNATPNKTIGIGIDPSGFSYNLPNRQKTFSYFSSDKTTTLDKRSPTKPILTPIISQATSVDTGRIISNPVYYTSQTNQIKFSWSAEAPYGGGIKRGYIGLSNKKPSGLNDSPNIKNFVPVDISTNILGGLNLKSGIYYLWLKAESNSGFTRITYVPLVVDNTPPKQSDAPKVSAPSENVYWVNSALNFDEETFLVSIDLEERKNTQLLWNNVRTIELNINNFISNFYLGNFETKVEGNTVTVSTRMFVSDKDIVEYVFVCSTTTSYNGEIINFDTLFLSNGLKINTASLSLESKMEDKLEKNFYFYRVKTKNSAGLYSTLSNSSEMAYLTLPEEKLSSVSSFPNPCDVRKGMVNIAYLLNQDMDVKLRIFDLSGNMVYEKSIDAGTDGAKIGPNFVEWKESKDVASGMYILLIEARTSSGDVVKKKWKIGIVK